MTNLTPERIERFMTALWNGDRQRYPVAIYRPEAEAILLMLPLFDRTDVIELD